MKNIKGAIFDVDGTLLDSMQIWASVGYGYLNSLGLKPTAELFEAISARNGVEASVYLQAMYSMDGFDIKPEDWRARMTEHIYLDGVTVKNGALQVLEMLVSRGIGVCAATATGRHLVEPALNKCGLSRYISRIFTCGEESTNKRSPVIFIRAATFLGTDICDTLVVEDSLHALQTVKNAGFLTTGVWDLASADQQDEIIKVCDYYCRSLEELPALLQ